MPFRSEISTALVTSESGFDALRPEWDRLLEASAQGVFFLRWQWLRAWWRSYGTGSLHIIVCRNAAGALIGIAPLYVATQRHFRLMSVREVRFLGTHPDVRTSEYLDVIARRGEENAVADAVAAALRAAPGWDRLWLWNILSQSSMLPALRVAFGPRAVVTPCDRAFVVDTSRDWAATSAGFQHDMDRAFRQALGQPAARLVRVQTPDELDAVMDDLVRLHQRRWTAKGQPGSFAVGPFESFLREVARDCLERGRLGLWRLDAGGRAVAALIAFVDFGVAHYFQSGFDPDAGESLGQVIVGLAIRDCVAADGIGGFDLMGGHSDYKSEWTDVTRESVELEYLNGWRGSLFAGLRSLRERLARIRRRYR